MAHHFGIVRWERGNAMSFDVWIAMVFMAQDYYLFIFGSVPI